MKHCRRWSGSRPSRSTQKSASQRLRGCGQPASGQLLHHPMTRQAWAKGWRTTCRWLHHSGEGGGRNTAIKNALKSLCYNTSEHTQRSLQREQIATQALHKVHAWQVAQWNTINWATVLVACIHSFEAPKFDEMLIFSPKPGRTEDLTDWSAGP